MCKIINCTNHNKTAKPLLSFETHSPLLSNKKLLPSARSEAFLSKPTNNLKPIQ